MAYDRDIDANAPACFAQWEPLPVEELEQDYDPSDYVRCPKHGQALILDYDAEANEFICECGCRV